MKFKFMTGVATIAVSCTLGAMVLAPQSGASPSGQNSSWHVGYYTPSNRTLSMAQAGPGGLGTVSFTNMANTALLLSTQGGSGYLGNDLNETVTATFHISGSTGNFMYYGEPDACGTPANTRLFFETSYAGGFDFTKYWWADSAFAYLGDGDFTLTATISPAGGWSDWNGQPSASNGPAFVGAASNVTGIGLSFGGGCGFENGVGTTDGSGSLTLDSFSVL